MSEIQTIFESREEFQITEAIIKILNDFSEGGIDDTTLTNSVLAAAAVYAHHTVNKHQLGLFIDQDRNEITKQLSGMIDQISINKGQYNLPLAN